MHFTRTLFVGASMVAAALAQTTPIAFTMTPAAIAVGQSYKISWGGGDGTSPVTLTLKQGTPSNLQTVALITGAAGNGSYTWTVPSNLVNGNNYALQISQGLDDVNYSGQFALTGGASSSMTSSLASTTSMPASTSGAIGLAPVVVPASLSSILTSLNGTISSAIAAANGSMTGAAASAGTGVAMSRNTTMSMATLPTSGAAAGATSGSSAASSTGSSAPSSTGSSGASGTSGASGSSGAGAAGSSSTTAPKAGAAAGLASPLALVFSAIAAIVYLN